MGKDGPVGADDMKEYMGFVTAWKRPDFRGRGGAHRKGVIRPPCGEVLAPPHWFHPFREEEDGKLFIVSKES